MGEIGIGPTANQRVLGCLREVGYALRLECERPRFATLEELQMYFAEYIYSPTGYRYPREFALELFSAAGTAPPRIH